MVVHRKNPFAVPFSALLLATVLGFFSGGAGGGCGGPLGSSDSSGGGSGSCSDSGASCAQDSTVVRWKSQCSNNSNSQAPCYCAAAATDACFLAKGCYKEAGASTSVTQAQLRSMEQQMLSAAASLGTRCF